MTTDTLRPEPPPVRWSFFVAVLLELLIVLEFVHRRSWLGLALCLGYGWFSATRAAFVGVKK